MSGASVGGLARCRLSARTIVNERYISATERMNIPSSVTNYLKESRIPQRVTGPLKAVAESDYDPAGAFGETWIVAGTRALVVIDPATRTHTLHTYKDLSELKVETMVSSGVLSVKVDGTDTLLLRFSNTKAREFGHFSKVVGKLISGERLKSEDTAAEDFSPTCPTCGLRYPDPDRKVCPKCLNRRSLFKRLLSYLPKYRRPITIVLVMILISSALKLATPFLGGRILFDEVLNDQGRYYGMVIQIVLLMIATRLLTVGVDIIYGRINAKITAQVFYDLKVDIYTNMQRLSYGFFTKKQTGGLMTRINWDALQLQYLFLDGVPWFLASIITIAGISVVMFLLDWRLSLFVLIPTPLIVLISRGVLPKLWSLLSRRFRKQRVLSSLVNDALTGMRVVKAFGKEREEIQRFRPANSGVFSSNMNLVRFESSVFPFLGLIMRVGGLLVWAIGGWFVVGGNISFGMLMTFVGYLALIYQPLQWITMIADWGSSAMNAAQRIFEIMDAIPDVAERPDPVRVQRIKGKIELRNVTFAYEPNKPVLHNVSFSIRPGEMIGLVGHTGAGKSTLTNLITRLYDVDEGSIRIDGVNVKDIAMADLRSQIGIVLQDTFIFNGTIAENISYARPDATREEIVESAELASAHDFIVSLPDGYDTMLGKNGKDLSGGERQRISIARAILLSPSILVFDEATSSVDSQTEQRIQQAIGRMVEGRTTIAIAHRLSTLRLADRLVVVKEGKIEEIGTHEELLKTKGTYAKMVKSEKEALRVIGVGEK